jgi:hypothetical protein
MVAFSRKRRRRCHAHRNLWIALPCGLIVIGAILGITLGLDDYHRKNESSPLHGDHMMNIHHTLQPSWTHPCHIVISSYWSIVFRQHTDGNCTIRICLPIYSWIPMSLPVTRGWTFVTTGYSSERIVGVPSRRRFAPATDFAC